MKCWVKKSAFAAMASFAASERAILPRNSYGAPRMYADWNMMPCLGGKVPERKCLNSAVSAPITCTVEPGIFAKRSNPPAVVTRRAASMGSVRCAMFLRDFSDSVEM